MENVKEAFWKKKWFSILLLVLFPPAGIALLWINRKFNLKVLVILSVLGMIWFAFALIVGGQPTETANPAHIEASESSILIEDAAPNTSEKVGAIYHQAKADATSIDIETTRTAVNFIRDNYPNYFKDNETMEQTMYYGALLDNAYGNDDYGLLGWDAYQVVKYVYRHEETPDSEFSVSNLNQIKESLEEID